jgi:hypothetical protein
VVESTSHEGIDSDTNSGIIFRDVCVDKKEVRISNYYRSSQFCTIAVELYINGIRTRGLIKHYEPPSTSGGSIADEVGASNGEGRG